MLPILLDSQVLYRGYCYYDAPGFYKFDKLPLAYGLPRLAHRLLRLPRFPGSPGGMPLIQAT